MEEVANQLVIMNEEIRRLRTNVFFCAMALSAVAGSIIGKVL